MRSVRRPTAWLIACGCTWALAAALPSAQPPQKTPHSPQEQGGALTDTVPTAIEEALIEHACGGMRPAGAPETAPYLECRRTQLAALRDEFGRDLRRLTNGERRTIDAACSSLRISRGQDAYIECLAAQLNSLRGHGARAKREPVAAAESAPAVVTPDAAIAPVPAAPPPPGWSGVWLGAGVAVLIIAAGGGAFMMSKARRSFGTCRTCGVALPERGDLCQKCRHEAADTLRRAAAARVEQARAQEDETRRQAAREDEQRAQQARDEDARRQQAEETERERQRRQQESERQREEEARQQRQTDATAAPDEFDPHVVLGVAPGASAVEIDAAYKTARAKYDLDLVADMGGELLDHFKRKAQAVERAYEALAPRPSD